MSRNPLRRFTTRATPPHDPVPGRDQVPGLTGGWSFAVDEWTRLRRFLVLGDDGGSYHATGQELVTDDALAVLRGIALDGRRTVEEVVEVAEAGRNPRHEPVILALAACAAAEDGDVRRRALAALPRVCRTGTDLLLFAGYVEQFRGWGRDLRRAVARWYTDRDADALALQLIEDQQHEGRSHRDLLRLAKPAPDRNSPIDVALRWAAGRTNGSLPDDTPALIRACESARLADDPTVTAALVANENLPWEALRPEHLASPEVWDALIDRMALDALVRDLGRMTATGALAPDSDAAALVVARLGDGDQLRAARLHPVAVLSALLTYRSGREGSGELTWAPVAAVVDALDAAFYASFGAVEAAQARTMIALDVSASMTYGDVAGVPGLTPRLASAAMTAITLATEPSVETVAFTAGRASTWRPSGASRDRYGLTVLPLADRQRLDDLVAAVHGLPFGATDCALPVLFAMDRGLRIDTFVIYTDSETWAGDVHPVQALRRYRQHAGIAARLVVVGLVSNGFTIADPDDGGMLDVVGFDTAAAQLIADFSAGRL